VPRNTIIARSIRSFVLFGRQEIKFLIVIAWKLSIACHRRKLERKKERNDVQIGSNKAAMTGFRVAGDLLPTTST